MSIVSELRGLLDGINPPVFRIVGGAAEFAALAGEPKATPAAYVLVEEEQSEDNARMTGPVLQRVEADVAVIIVTRNVSDNTGAAAAEEIETLKAKVRGALMGFVPAGDGSDPITHVSGSLLKAKSGNVWQRELFAAAYYLEEQP
ncbi:MAG: hypothetical protein EOR97_17275 [Mesorhizobium sp.]|uniref:phage tail terminator protein n=1 Tax=Mesorhizobium sp. TaxID=1871066 RepID=UPI000FE9D40A|nr:hypothetical protein [Mesorhizobium sp.]RWN30124.1 MAG: hypothetical protein EOR97_17275 [Mesorhizobium sp.]